MHWRLAMEEYEYEIIYKPGIFNTNADALSRIPQIMQIEGEQLVISNKTYNEYMDYVKTNVVQNLNIMEVAGNIFEDDQASLVHHISQELTLKEGLSLEFRRRFGNLEINQNKEITYLLHLKEGNRYIIYMVLSEKEKSQITYENVYHCLQNLRTFCLNNQITDLALSKTGDQIFQLDWATVRIMLRYLFKGTKIKLRIFKPNELTDKEKNIIIREMHENPLAGHRGISNTIKKN